MSERRTTWECICNSALVAQSQGEQTYPADIDVLLDTDTELRQLRAVAEAAAAFREAEETYDALSQSRCPDDHDDDVQMATQYTWGIRYQYLCAALDALAGEGER